MTACIVVAGVLQCIVSTAPPLSPEAAARTLLPGRFVARETSVVEVLVPVLPSRPQDGPYGPLSFQRLEEWRRLDGSYMSDPQWIYWGRRDDRRRRRR